MKNKLILVPAILVPVILALILVFVALLWPRTPNPWQPTTEAYKVDCGAECSVISSVTPGHKGSALPLIYNPKVNDEIAQWGDCIETVMKCVRQANTFKECVDEDVSCPAICVEKFQSKVQNITNPKRQRKIFESIFIDDGGLCVPEDREIQ